MTDAMSRYRELERKLWVVRFRTGGKESVEEDNLLDQMDEVWSELDNAERQYLNQEGARCWPMEAPGAWPKFQEVRWPKQPGYEEFASPMDTLQQLDPTG